MLKTNNLPANVQAGENRIFTISTAQLLEHKRNAMKEQKNCEAAHRVACILWNIGERMSKTPDNHDNFSYPAKLVPSHGVSTRDWEDSHDGLIRIGLKIRFRIGNEEHESEILRVKFNSEKSGSMLLKGREIVKTEVLVWNPEKSGDADIERAFSKIEGKLVEIARKVVQHEINRRLFLHLAIKYNGSVEDALSIPGKGILVIDDMIKVRDAYNKTYYHVEGKYTESLQSAIDFAISSFEKKYHLVENAVEPAERRGVWKYLFDHLPENIKPDADKKAGKKNVLGMIGAMF